VLAAVCRGEQDSTNTSDGTGAPPRSCSDQTRPGRTTRGTWHFNSPTRTKGRHRQGSSSKTRTTRSERVDSPAGFAWKQASESTFSVPPRITLPRLLRGHTSPPTAPGQLLTENQIMPRKNRSLPGFASPGQTLVSFSFFVRRISVGRFHSFTRRPGLGHISLLDDASICLDVPRSGRQTTFRLTPPNSGPVGNIVTHSDWGLVGMPAHGVFAPRRRQTRSLTLAPLHTPIHSPIEAVDRLRKISVDITRRASGCHSLRGFVFQNSGNLAPRSYLPTAAYQPTDCVPVLGYKLVATYADKPTAFDIESGMEVHSRCRRTDHFSNRRHTHRPSPRSANHVCRRSHCQEPRCGPSGEGHSPPGNVGRPRFHAVSHSTSSPTTRRERRRRPHRRGHLPPTIGPADDDGLS